MPKHILICLDILYMPYRRKMIRSKPVTKDYVKKAIEAKRDVLTNCALKQAGLSYNDPFIYNVTPNNVLVQGQGQDIDFHSLDLHFGITGPGNNFVRVMVVQWFEDSGVGTPTLDDILCTTPSVFSYADGYQKNTLHQKFVVVRDQLIARNDNFQSAGHNTVGKMRIRKKDLQRKVIRSTGSGNFKNNLYLIALSNKQSQGNTAPTMNLGITYQFKSRD